MLTLQKLSVATASAAVVTLGTVGTAQAATFHEVGDAGTFPFSSFAQTVHVEPGETLDSIVGSFNHNFFTSFDIDMFRVELNAGSFSARVSDGQVPGERSLFLFNANGLGIAANRGNGTIAALEGNLESAGTYFLGIGHGRSIDWRSSSGSIFSAANWATPQFGATGSGAGRRPGSVSSSGARNFRGSSYTIAIANEPPQPVPESSSVLGLLAFGAFATLSGLKHKQQKA
ncbi:MULTISPECIES: hypothetical protein [unclassified Coleofasciculus]|uniref:hypothetical protein n=1 Tax=unclassified Coleofasciculus TaxID=2692782 RepID=UPI00187F4526|nr:MULTISPECIES: hypothetical protein [unclassified Coleofasciculus]MBE9125757.1 hypothetical protein [Coleofasciculus sp. LEGE 07081]MBE9147245.1 hypothetical protein [Coleofasciculus sp. LEGE 07092]